MVNTPQDANSPSPIKCPANDPFFPPRTQFLPFLNSSRSNNGNGIPSLSTAALDLSQVYGSSLAVAKSLRLGKGGRLRRSPGDFLAMSPSGYFKSGDPRAGEHPMLTTLHTLFSRAHNAHAASLRKLYPKWKDEQLFQVARERNIAIYQRIVETEFLPLFTGGTLPYKGYKPYVDPTVSLEFSTAAFRVGHSMVAANMAHLPLGKVFFLPPARFRALGGLEGTLKAQVRARALSPGLHVTNALRNGLFTAANRRGVGQIAVDLVSNNIQRGRDHALPKFNAVRRRLRLKPYRGFAELSKHGPTQQRLRKAYGNIDKVDLWPGLMAEDVESKNDVIGQTTKLLWKEQFHRSIHGDRRWWRSNPHTQLIKYHTMREIILLHSKLNRKFVQFDHDVWTVRKAKK